MPRLKASLRMGLEKTRRILAPLQGWPECHPVRLRPRSLCVILMGSHLRQRLRRAGREAGSASHMPATPPAWPILLSRHVRTCWKVGRSTPPAWQAISLPRHRRGPSISALYAGGLRETGSASHMPILLSRHVRTLGNVGRPRLRRGKLSVYHAKGVGRPSARCMLVGFGRRAVLRTCPSSFLSLCAPAGGGRVCNPSRTCWCRTGLQPVSPLPRFRPSAHPAPLSLCFPAQPAV